MFKIFISLLMISLSLNMFFINHPLMMGMFILIQTVLTSVLAGLYLSNYWFSYILFLVFLGGLLILFIYVSSIAYNELMKFSSMSKANLVVIPLTIFFFTVFMYKSPIFNEFFDNNEMNNFYQSFLFFTEYKINLTKLYNKQTFLMIMMLIIYLFITLIAVIKITNIFFGPLRSFN